MLKTIAIYLILVFFGLVMLSLVLAVTVSLAVSLSAIVYRLIPGPNVPFGYNLRNMFVRWKNTVVTAAAFVVVIGLLVVMLAFVNSMYRLTQGSARPGNLMLLQDGSNDESFSSLPPTVELGRLPMDVQNAIPKNKDGEHMATKEVYVVVNQPIPNAPPSGKQRRFVQMRGIDKSWIAASVHGIELQDGKWFSQEGLRKIAADSASGKDFSPTALTALAGVAAPAAAPDDRAIEVVIGAGIAKELGTDKDITTGKPRGTIKVSDILDIGGRKWIVTGIMSTGNSSFASEMWCRDTILQEQFGRRNSYSTFVIALNDPVLAEKVSKELKNYKELSVNVMTEKEYYANLNATNQQFLFSIIVVAIIMAVGGVLGVMNTMFAAISQRAKDIGVLRLLGYTRWQILVSFLLESLSIAFIGGIIGCALGYFLADGVTASSIVSGGQGGGKSVILRMSVDAATLGFGLLLTFIMGSVGGFVPALSAMRLRPLESLR
ncbi:MAG TPA: FtsX-like permease family protein [Gemmataceae bacterium]|nr:FtsX-like permease family protein [Gemmataceae bacterium]